MPPLTNYTRVIVGLSVGTLIVLIGVFSLRELGEISDTSLTTLNWQTYLQFYLAVFMIYATTIFLWSKFCVFATQPRSMKEYVIDTGLLAIGKYVPGKILGIAMRGAVQSNTIKLQGKNVKISFIEQLCVLIVGVLLGISIYAKQYLSTANLLLTTVTLVLCCWLAVFLCIRISQQFLNFPKNHAITPLAFSFRQTLGYLLLWIMTSIPILVLIWQHHTLLPIQAAQVLLAFTFAMLSGWVAFFAPGGIGIRESSFVMLAPAFMEWQDAATWIVLHRVLITIFDISYGLVVSIWVLRTVRKVAI